MATPKIIADFETQLATAIAVAGTSFTLSSATDDDGVSLPAGLYYFTVDNGSSAKEYLSGTLSGTSVTGVVSVSRQGVETSGAVRAHRVGASVIITDFATYKKYMDAIALVSAPDASTSVKGVVEEATQAETDARTTTGATTARLYINPGTQRSTLYSDYAADAGGTDSYAITVTPAITAYTAGQEFTFKANTGNTGAATLNVSGLGAKTIKKNVSTDLSTGDITASQIVKVIYDGANMQMVSDLPAIKFGGSGADGALSISSGTTTLDLGAALYFEKNYSSISITGTASLAFTNPHASGTVIVIKSRGDVTLTSSNPSIDTRGMGATAGTGGTSTGGGTDGTNCDGRLITTTAPKGLGGAGAGGSGGVAGAQIDNPQFYTTVSTYLYRRDITILAGSGGGGGGSGGTSTVGGDGGRGGGGLLVECAGALNFTGTINSSGSNGGSGTGPAAANAAGGGGGGGSAGMVVVLYNSLTSAAGTVTAAGGAGGTPPNGLGVTGSAGGGGSGAGSVAGAGGTGANANAGAGSAGNSGAGGGGGGGLDGNGASGAGGAAGSSMPTVVAQNTVFA